MKKMNDGSDSLRAAQEYLNLPVLPGPIVADEDEKENETAISRPQPPAERPVQVQLIHQRDFDAMKAAEAAAAEARKTSRRRPAPKPSHRKKRPRASRAVAGAPILTSAIAPSAIRPTAKPSKRHSSIGIAPTTSAVSTKSATAPSFATPMPVGYSPCASATCAPPSETSSSVPRTSSPPPTE
jgi:hypothetical protein